MPAQRPKIGEIVAKKDEREGLGRFEVIVLFVLGMMFALYCVFGILKPPSITTMLGEIGSKYGQKHETSSKSPEKAE